MSLPFSIADAITEMTERLRSVSDSARLDAEILIARAIDVPRSYLYAHPEDVLDDAALERLQSTVTRRLSGEPMAYISGVKEFWSLELMVSPATLVPRAETELLVDLALRHERSRIGAREVDRLEGQVGKEARARRLDLRPRPSDALGTLPLRRAPVGEGPVEGFSR